VSLFELTIEEQQAIILSLNGQSVLYTQLDNVSVRIDGNGTRRDGMVIKVA
jgi:hypothetical protein